MTPDKALHPDIIKAVTCIVQIIEGAGEEAIFIRFQKFFVPEFIFVENVLG